jgi:hypothetical protein
VLLNVSPWTACVSSLVNKPHANWSAAGEDDEDVIVCDGGGVAAASGFLLFEHPIRLSSAEKRRDAAMR